ncbi:hydrophobic surface binding protein [Dendrothele bispora CBS 962.96]|uniref:Hydrophobic surface binding protein n=1 Tax=Dendrothele bispora (strain CBS 962.96) TaxID=1314807 RepID=A0A4S8LVL3_DENBC|nr:hydrophobic surface binding protein [Dendrothele bispora CBS 962.96]
MQLLTRTFVALSIAASTFGAVLKRDVPTILADISKISSQVTTLDNAINAFPDSGGSLVNALAIHTDATNLVSSVNTATSDTTANGAFNEADGQTILNAVQAIEPTILDALTAIAAKQPAFAALPIGGIPALVLQDLKNLDAGTTAFSNALIANAPADLVPQATDIQTTIGNAFDTAIAAYS